MKATSKMLGAFVLSASLVCGCALPAFAADEYGTRIGDYSDPTENLKQNDSAETQVKVATMITNINVAVPLEITIVADSAGGPILHPSSGLKHNTGDAYNGDDTTGYRIENYSTYPVAIKSIQVLDSSKGDWALVDAIAADGTTQEGRVGDLALTLTPSSPNTDTANKNEGNKGNGGVVNLAGLVTPKDPQWIVQRQVSKTEPSIMGLTLEGTSSALINVNEPSILLGDKDNPVADTNGDGYPDDPIAADNAFKIIYTVGAAKTAA